MDRFHKLKFLFDKLRNTHFILRGGLGLVLFLGHMSPASLSAQVTKETSYISDQQENGAFKLSSSGVSAPLFLHAEADSGIIRAISNLKTDIGKVSGTAPRLLMEKKVPKEKNIVIVGTIGNSPVIDQLITKKKLDVSGIEGKWETFLIQVVDKPMKGVDQALIIAGSDKRGTIYGIYDLSENIGVSPWYYWADVPVASQENLYVRAGRHSLGTPKVKYRGIFINDEWPALGGWAFEKFGGFNSKFYAHVFDLILRLKGNYLWPAMWGRQFYVDDPLNPKLADQYGVVVGTSHHEPMMRAHAEWEHFGEGPWNYKTNKENLQKFWREGIDRMGDYESIVTIGMRGDGDEAMSEGTEIELLEGIVEDQRKILAEETGKNAAETPQIWALYKEVQDYYDQGMRVPDDVTLLLADDNWGNIRKLPALGDTLRPGGYGIYYHFDYVGGPRNYKWINTNPLARVWEQMHLAYQYKANEIWIVNVGDLKPMEYPISFFLNYAWNPEEWPAESLPEYTRRWSEAQFGKQYATEIADILTKYTKYNGRRKPELLVPQTYSLIHYREAERIVEDYNALAEKAQKIYEAIPAAYKDAYYQLVLFPVLASANLNELYVTVAKNRLYAEQGRAVTNELADKARQLFERDSLLSHYYNNELAGGKWNHIMDQTHIGYDNWQEPKTNSLPEVKEISVPNEADMGVAIEGSRAWWPEASEEARLPKLTPFGQDSVYLEVFNRGNESLSYQLSKEASWLYVNPAQGEVKEQQRLWVSVDWSKAPVGEHTIPITITGPDKQKVVVQAIVRNPATLQADAVEGFVESNGYVAMEAENFTKAVGGDQIQWKVIPGLGKTKSGITPFPVTASEQEPGGNSPRLEYQMHLFDTGAVTVKVFVSPTLNLHNDQGLRFGISFDDEAPQIMNLHTSSSERDWNREVANNIKELVSQHNIEKPGKHVLKFWMVDPAVVLQRIVVETAEGKPSYLGPPESFFKAIPAMK